LIWRNAILLMGITLIISCSDFLADYTAVKFVAAANMGKWSYATELDSWSTITVDSNPLFEHVCFSHEGSGERFVAIGSRAAVSLDGRQIDYDVPSPGSPMYDIVYANGIFVTVGGGGERAMSADGITWTNHDDAGWESYEGLCYGNGYFLAVGASGQTSRTRDGINWDPAIFIPGAINFWAVTFGHGLFIAVGDNHFAYSADNGETWTVQASAHVLYGIAYGDGMFMAVGANGYCLYGNLQDLINGRHFYLGTNTLRDVIYSHNQFIAVGDTNKIYYGITPAGFKYTETDVSSGYRSITGNY
jgi:hypothetical protein